MEIAVLLDEIDNYVRALLQAVILQFVASNIRSKIKLHNSDRFRISLRQRGKTMCPALANPTTRENNKASFLHFLEHTKGDIRKVSD
eukprot:414305-Amphidinium_carterae.1